ncbi:hypothetical protein PCANC_17610 [Puccinia coronata f. sp. avenae]|uniref:Uncharacterized protein n=1 Tax=Puccinia coronata f. sp. avenae TaxID=200324 RepID=A0A2N5S861_9BASI|nr:hypothetical protein PCANC_17610 [Puccinia coronata f. sp. avenae]
MSNSSADAEAERHCQTDWARPNPATSAVIFRISGLGVNFSRLEFLQSIESDHRNTELWDKRLVPCWETSVLDLMSVWDRASGQGEELKKQRQPNELPESTPIDSNHRVLLELIEQWMVLHLPAFDGIGDQGIATTYLDHQTRLFHSRIHIHHASLHGFPAPWV